jgi:hypothetical protein
MNKGLEVVLRLLSADYKPQWDDWHSLAGLLGVGSEKSRRRGLTDEEKRTLAFLSYFLSAVEPKKYRKDTSAVSAIATNKKEDTSAVSAPLKMYLRRPVSEKTIWNARKKHRVDPKKISDVARAIEDDPDAEQRLMQQLRAIFFLIGGSGVET